MPKKKIRSMMTSDERSVLKDIAFAYLDGQLDSALMINTKMQMVVIDMIWKNIFSPERYGAHYRKMLGTVLGPNAQKAVLKLLKKGKVVDIICHSGHLDGFVNTKYVYLLALSKQSLTELGKQMLLQLKRQMPLSRYFCLRVLFDQEVS